MAMRSFYEFLSIIHEAAPGGPPGGGLGAPPAGGGIGGPPGGGLGGPPMGGMGGPPPMGGGMGGPPMGGMGPPGGAPPASGPAPTKELDNKDVWSILEKILSGKPVDSKNQGGQKKEDEVDSPPQPSKQPPLPSPQPPQTGAPPMGLPPGGMAGSPPPQQNF